MTRRSACLGSVALAVIVSACAGATPHSEEDVISVVEGFYGAMKSGDREAAMRAIAPDAVFLEGGQLETREQYESNHLPADIDFERQVSGKRGPMRVTFHGDSAWVIATTDYDGTFNDQPMSFTSAQLMVLTKGETGAWQIRSAHWSSRRR